MQECSAVRCSAIPSGFSLPLFFPLTIDLETTKNQVDDEEENIEQKVQNAPRRIFRRPHRRRLGRTRCGRIRVALARRKGTVLAKELGPKIVAAAAVKAVVPRGVAVDGRQGEIGTVRNAARAHGRLHAKARNAAVFVVQDRAVIVPATLQSGRHGLGAQHLVGNGAGGVNAQHGRHQVAACGQWFHAQILLLQRPAAVFDKDRAESDLLQCSQAEACALAAGSRRRPRQAHQIGREGRSAKYLERRNKNPSPGGAVGGPSRPG